MSDSDGEKAVNIGQQKPQILASDTESYAGSPGSRRATWPNTDNRR